MSSNDKTSLPPGVQPYDRLNGARIGALAGGVIGVVPTLLLWPAFGWLLAGAAAGGVVGYLWQRRDEEKRRG